MQQRDADSSIDSISSDEEEPTARTDQQLTAKEPIKEAGKEPAKASVSNLFSFTNPFTTPA